MTSGQFLPVATSPELHADGILVGPRTRYNFPQSYHPSVHASKFMLLGASVYPGEEACGRGSRTNWCPM